MADITRDGRCEITGDFGFVRAKTILNTKSPHDFRWSMMLASGYPVDVGIATKLPRRSIHSSDFLIHDVDPHCILFEPYATGIGLEITIFSGHTVFVRFLWHLTEHDWNFRTILNPV